MAVHGAGLLTHSSYTTSWDTTGQHGRILGGASIGTSDSFAIGGDTAIGRLEALSTCALRTEGI